MSEQRTDHQQERLDERQARRDGQAGEPGGEAMRVPVNVYETDGALVIVAPLPGVMAKDIEIRVDGNKVHIWASMRTPAPKKYLIHEWHYGPFERELEIPDGFGASPIASFGNGQLAVSLGRGEPEGGSITITPASH
jgi:HSP20 family molecular chaperone IbpA